MTIDTETIDRLFLELSQFTQATTAKELALQAEVDRLREQLRVYDKRIVAVGGIAINSVHRSNLKKP